MEIKVKPDEDHQIQEENHHHPNSTDSHGIFLGLIITIIAYSIAYFIDLLLHGCHSNSRCTLHSTTSLCPLFSFSFLSPLDLGCNNNRM